MLNPAEKPTRNRTVQKNIMLSLIIKQLRLIPGEGITSSDYYVLKVLESFRGWIQIGDYFGYHLN